MFKDTNGITNESHHKKPVLAHLHCLLICPFVTDCRDRAIPLISKSIFTLCTYVGRLMNENACMVVMP